MAPKPKRRGHEVQFFAVTVTDDPATYSPEELAKWHVAGDKELNNALESGVLRLSNWTEVKERRAKGEMIEVLPSLVVRTIKPDGRYKQRHCACGNHQKVLREGNTFSGAVELLHWRLLLILHVLNRGSVAGWDIKEAFSRTAPETKTDADATIMLRLPQLWKSHLMPTFLQESGVTTDNFSEFLLEVLISVYGLADAPRRFAETLSNFASECKFWGEVGKPWGEVEPR